MKQTVVLKLDTTPAQHDALLATMEAFNRACQYVADEAYARRTASKVALQPIVYAELRNRFGLSAQMAVRCISKACEIYRRDKRVHVHFTPHDAMIYDAHILSIKGLTHISMLCLSGRQLIPYRFHSYQPLHADRVAGQADVILQEEIFYLLACIDLPTPPPDSIVIAFSEQSSPGTQGEDTELTTVFLPRRAPRSLRTPPSK